MYIYIYIREIFKCLDLIKLINQTEIDFKRKIKIPQVYRRRIQSIFLFYFPFTKIIRIYHNETLQAFFSSVNTRS